MGHNVLGSAASGRNRKYAGYKLVSYCFGICLSGRRAVCFVQDFAFRLDNDYDNARDYNFVRHAIQINQEAYKEYMDSQSNENTEQ